MVEEHNVVKAELLARDDHYKELLKKATELITEVPSTETKIMILLEEVSEIYIYGQFPFPSIYPSFL